MLQLFGYIIVPVGKFNTAVEEFRNEVVLDTSRRCAKLIGDNTYTSEEEARSLFRFQRGYLTEKEKP